MWLLELLYRRLGEGSVTREEKDHELSRFLAKRFSFIFEQIEAHSGSVQTALKFNFSSSSVPHRTSDLGGQERYSIETWLALIGLHTALLR